MAEAGRPLQKNPPRRRELRRGVARTKRWTLARVLAHPSALPLALIALGLIASTSLIVGLTRGVPLVSEGVANRTRLVRVEFKKLDEFGTRERRNQAMAQTPRVYDAAASVFEALRTSLLTLPEVLATVASYADVAPEVRDAFGLTEDQFSAIKDQANGAAAGAWTKRITTLIGALTTTPLLAGAEHQVAMNQSPSPELMLRVPNAEPRPAPKVSAINIDAADLEGRLTNLVNQAGLFGDAAEVVVQRIALAGAPTYVFDEAATEAAQQAQARLVPDQYLTFATDQPLTVRGRPITPADVDLVRREQREFDASRSAAERVIRGVAITGSVAVVILALAGYLGLFYREAAGSVGRLARLAGLMAAGLLASCWVSASAPALLTAAVSGPTIMIAVIAAVAHDRRFGIAVGTTQTALLALALGLTPGMMAVALAGVGVSVWRLAEIRSRSDALRGALITGAGVLAGVIVFGFLERPLVASIWREHLTAAAWAGVGGFLAGSLTLVILPTVEQAFGATTGMTLAELRDPNRPLLRLLQQEAPGTHNHSMNVASIAQSAAESIGADGLHVYVGALYHDVGKLNKPGYFVENQQGGASKHTNLSPAMSLLVIVGHVKDGVQLGREYGLPDALIHYIESHHGTTLVEYFYDQAKRQADAEAGVDAPAELEYRYPGPKPRTREAAILMLSDAVESAARAMKEPTPARIEALVSSLAIKRLLDGQFDDCALTLRELHTIAQSLTKSLNAIYHGRIAYPKAEPKEPAKERPATTVAG